MFGVLLLKLLAGAMLGLVWQAHRLFSFYYLCLYLSAL
jgi:hypothetical protein